MGMKHVFAGIERVDFKNTFYFVAFELLCDLQDTLLAVPIYISLDALLDLHWGISFVVAFILSRFPIIGYPVSVMGIIKIWGSNRFLLKIAFMLVPIIFSFILPALIFKFVKAISNYDVSYDP